jgi:signal transduction histidine kinase
MLVKVSVGGGNEEECPGENCKRKFRAWSKRSRDEALIFYKNQPSTERKRLREHEDGRWVVSYVYDETQQSSIPRIENLGMNLEMLRLLLTCVSVGLRAPAVLAYAKESNKRLQDLSVDEVKRLEIEGIEKLYLFPCLFLNKVLGAKKCSECDARRVLYYAGNEEFYDGGEKREEEAPWRYDCWLGFSEFAYPIRLGNEIVAIFIIGQEILKDAEMGKRLDRSKAALEKAYPKLEKGVEINLTELEEAGFCLEQIDEVKKRGKCGDDEKKVCITSATIYELAQSDALRLNRLIDAKDVISRKKNIKENSEIVVKFLADAYANKRRLAEEKFLFELFALLECLPSDPKETDRVIWVHTKRILRRICEFTGFRNGAICVPRQHGLNELVVTVAYCKDNEKKQSELDSKVISIGEKYYNKLRNARYISLTDNKEGKISGISMLLGDMVSSCLGDTDVSKTECVSYLEFKDEIISREESENKDKVEEEIPYALLGLWERTSWHSDGMRKKISEQDNEFVKRIAYELSVGFRWWLSLLQTKKTEKARRGVIAESVHGLKSSVHLARNKADIIETVLKRENVAEQKELIFALMRSIASDLINFSHQINLANMFTVLDQGQQVSYEVKHFELPGMIMKRSISLFESSAKKRHIEIVMEDNLEYDVKIKCDPGALEIAFAAILDNAVKYSYDGRIICVRLKDMGSNIAIEVEDFGRGILPEESEKIFKPFCRSEYMDKKRYVGGTGIGLAVCRGVITAHNGKVRLKESVQGDKYHGGESSMISGHKVVFEIILPKGNRR